MERSILDEYQEINEEVKMLEERIEKKRKQLAKISKEGTVIDTVKGGMGGTQLFKIEGCPRGTISLVEQQIEHQEFILKCRYNKLIEQQTEVEKFISELPTSELRRIVTYKYIDGLEWDEVAKKMGPGRTGTSVRLLFSRYIAKQSKSEYDEIIEKDKKFR
jgi:hypothetical protein